MKTECPHCHTIFNIRQQQLELADGMVRCGMCQQVFNALVQPDLFDDHGDSPGDGATETVAHNPSSGGQDNRHSPSDQPRPQRQPETDNDRPAEHNILFDENEPATLVPDELRHGGHHRGLFTTLTLAAACLLLGVTLALQFAWYQRDYLLSQTWAQNLIARACQRIDCSALQLRDPDKIELSSRNVYTHPTEKNALMVSLTLVNRAPYTQAYPDIQLEFSDRVGTVIAARRLRPAEYLDAATDNLQPLAPDTPVSLALEIVDPGKQALTYEFKFL